MPIKLTKIAQSVPERIANLRATIKRGEGLTMDEVAAQVQASGCRVRSICSEGGRRWTIKNYNPETGRVESLLVNPADYAEYEKAGLCPKK